MLAYDPSQENALGYSWEIATFIKGKVPNGSQDVLKTGFYEELGGLMAQVTKLSKFDAIASVYFASDLKRWGGAIATDSTFKDYFTIGPIIDVWFNHEFYSGVPASESRGPFPTLAAFLSSEILQWRRMFWGDDKWRLDDRRSGIFDRLQKVGEKLCSQNTCTHFMPVHTDLVYCNLILGESSRQIAAVFDWEGAMVLPTCFATAIMNVCTPRYGKNIGTCRHFIPVKKGSECKGKKRFMYHEKPYGLADFGNKTKSGHKTLPKVCGCTAGQELLRTFWLLLMQIEVHDFSSIDANLIEFEKTGRFL